MEALLEAIRAATAPDAPQKARASGIEACRSLLVAFGAEQGQPLANPQRAEPGPVATALAALMRTTPPEQLLDMAIAKLRALVPDDGQPLTPMFRVRRVGVPKP